MDLPVYRLDAQYVPNNDTLDIRMHGLVDGRYIDPGWRLGESIGMGPIDSDSFRIPSL